MAFKDLQRFLVHDLEIPLNGTTYHVKPPTKEAGLTLASFIALGMNAQRGHDANPEDVARVEANKHTSLAELALGADVHTQMQEDGVPEAHIDQAAIYSMYYWCLGEEAADNAFEILYSSIEQGDLPKDLRPLKIGPNTASESPTKTESTPATRSPRNPSDHKPPTAKKAASRGKKPSTIGD